MEFYKVLEVKNIDLTKLKEMLSLENLPTLCDSIINVSTIVNNTANIYCIWGGFEICKEELAYGVRFSLLTCPHALAWTITYHKQIGQLVVYCTIDKRTEADEFVESIEVFMQDWATGLDKLLN